MYPTIAIVDDDPDDLIFIEEALKAVKAEFQIKPYQSSVGFMDYLHSTLDLPVLIVMDYNMPKMNAEDILIQIKENKRLSPVKAYILSTGMSSALKEKLIALGAHCCIAKPSSIQHYDTLALDIIKLATALKNGVWA